MIDDQRRVKRLLGRYGDYVVNILDNASVSGLTKIADTEYCLAECRWAIKNEAVIHLDDLMLRRTRLGLLLRNGGEELFDSLQPIFSEELGWDQVHWKQEIVRYLNIWQQYYSLPLSEGRE